jgi:uroporphyrinogen-III synthase
VTKDLSGIGIAVTRPAAQSEQLVRLIQDAGGETLLFPGVEIQPLDVASLEPVLKRLACVELLIFISPNAVRMSMPHIVRRGALAAQTKIAAVGPATATELRKYGVREIISSQQGFDSEALLEELSALPLDQKHVVIVRGKGGRALLGETLRSRGAVVEYLECYRRSKPHNDMLKLRSNSGGSAVKACLATSPIIVQNLFEMAGAEGEAWLRSVPFFVSHPRVAATAFSRGVQSVFIAGTGDAALVEGLKIWFARRRQLDGLA